MGGAAVSPMPIPSKALARPVSKLLLFTVWLSNRFFFNLTILVCQANQAIEKQDIKIRMSGASLKTSSFMNLTTCDLAGSLGSLI
jgi:hypothetical protein